MVGEVCGTSKERCSINHNRAAVGRNAAKSELSEDFRFFEQEAYMYV
jgi:hypothetical protein